VVAPISAIDALTNAKPKERWINCASLLSARYLDIAQW